jgi:hypothetical protein
VYEQGLTLESLEGEYGVVSAEGKRV